MLIVGKYQNQNRKKSGCLKPVIIFFLILIVFGGLNGGGSKDSNTSEINDATKKPKTTATATKTPKVTKTPKPTNTATPTPTLKPTKKLANAEDVKDMLYDMLSEKYSYVEIDIIDTGFNICISTDNIGTAAYYTQTLQSKDLLEEWDIMCDSLAANCKDIQKFIENEGLDVETVMLFLVNDQDPSLALVSVVNGFVIQNSVTRK